MEEKDLRELAAGRDLRTKRSEQDGLVSWRLSMSSGENVVVMFREGICVGIQRMRPEGSREPPR